MSEMIKTNKMVCASCKYSRIFGTDRGTITCDYYLDTGNLRNCPVGLCDKYKKKINKNRS